MSIFNKVNELFYVRPINLASNSTRCERDADGEDLIGDYCKFIHGFRGIANCRSRKRGDFNIVCVDAEVLVVIVVSARAKDALVGGYNFTDRHKKRVLQRGLKAYIYQLQNSLKHVRFDVIDFSLSNEGDGDTRYYGNVPLFSKLYYQP